MPYTEANYENAVVRLFVDELGYTHLYGPDVERDYHSPLYEEGLWIALARLNPRLPQMAIQEAVDKLRTFDTGTLLQKNITFTDYLQNGVPVKFWEGGEERSALVYLVDYQNPKHNDFVVANQWTVVENSEKRPDVVLFVNGLPLVVMELKSPSREETDASEAYRQLRNYMHEIPSLFVYNQVCVISDLFATKAGTITSGEDRFMAWKTKDGSYENTKTAQFDTFFEGIFQKERFLDILKNFICFNLDGEKTFKILAGYHQYFAVRKAIASTQHATQTDGKGGVFWHTQGSGKSLSMVFYAHLLQQALESPTVVVITDRNDLDDQLYGQFCRCREFLRQTPQQATSREHLRELLENFARRERVEALSGVRLVIENRELKKALVAGEEIDDGRIYKVATIDFLLFGGSNAEAFKKCGSYVDTGVFMRDMVTDYIKDKTAAGMMIESGKDGRTVVIKAEEQ